MIRTTTLTKDDGTVIRTTTEELQTEKNWNKKQYKLRKNAVGEEMKWRSSSGDNKNSRFYSDSEVLPMTEREKARYLEEQRQKRKEARNRKKAEEQVAKDREASRIRRAFQELSGEGRVIVLDTETTGLDSSDEILQLAVVDADGTTLINERFRPVYKTAWPDAQRVNGISPEDVTDKPTIYDAKDEIQDILDSADIIVGYNTPFDMGMLSHYGIVPKKDVRVVDIMPMFAVLYGEWDAENERFRYKKLVDCAEYYDYEWGDTAAHDALADALATAYCYGRMKEQL